MANLLRNNWPKLWTPNADEFTGDPTGLLRADNLTLEEDGSISVIRGTQKISHQPLTQYVSQIYSKTINLAEIMGDYANWKEYSKVRYLVSGSKVIRNYGNTFKREDVFELGVTDDVSPAWQQAAFGYGFGHVFIFYGNQKKKDNGNPLGISNVGIPAAQPPYPTPNNGYFIWLSENPPGSENYSGWENIDNGSVFNATPQYVEIDMDTENLTAIAMLGLTTSYNKDTTNFQGVSDRDTPEDVFRMSVRIADTNKFVKVVVTFILRDPTVVSTSADSTDYFQFEWGSGTAFNPGVNSWSTISCFRRDFERVGTDSTLGWKTVRGIKVSFINSEYSNQTFLFQTMQFRGSTLGPLKPGQYTYIQVDVQNNGYYLEKSIGSPGSIIAELQSAGTINVNPTTVNGNANECWIYRYGVGLNQYYLVKKLTGTNGFDPAAFEDNVSDEEALRTNIKLDEFVALLPDNIIGMECNWKGRNWYITRSTLYPSYRDNPSAYDYRYIIETANKNAEINYFITRLSSDVMVLGTSADFYEITGTGGVLTQDNIDFFDVTVRPMGMKSPPISSSFVVREGNLFYFASDGIRVLSGSNCQLLSANIDLLFKNHVRHGINPLRILSNLREKYYLGIAKNRLYFSTVQTDNRRALYVYNFEDNNWRYENHPDSDAPLAIWVEEDDTIIYSTAEFGDRYLRQLDVGKGWDQIGPTGINFLTTFDDNGQPRNRKDGYTLKLVVDTGLSIMNVSLKGFRGVTTFQSQSNTTLNFTSTVATSGKAEVLFQIYDSLLTCKSYQLEITGNSNSFKLYNWSIDYDARPEQLTSLRIPNTTFGIAGRKRLEELPFIIDTLTNNTTIQPIIDSSVKPTVQFVTAEKMLCTYFFKEETIGFNIGALITGGPFEFYEMVQPRNIELLPDPTKYKFVPYTNFGKASQKRFIQYAITIDTRNEYVRMIPVIDGVDQQPLDIITDRKKTIVYTFNTFAVGTDVACKLFHRDMDTALYNFEFYEVNLDECVSEKLPAVARRFHIPATNFNTSSRKRIRQYAFVCDTHGAQVIFTPYVDGVIYPPQTFTTIRKETCIYTFDSFVAGIDISGTIEGEQEFMFYEVSLEECVYEKLPPIASHIVIPYHNFGTSARKKFRSVAMTIDTRGKNVNFIPLLDGVPLASGVINTNRKETYNHTFWFQTIGIDLGGTLQSADGFSDFEFYGMNYEESVYEKLPAKQKYLELPTTNYGIAARKRIRTIPFVINTFGYPVTYKPIVDGEFYPSENFTTNDKTTVLYYFLSDNDSGKSNGLTSGIPFGIDYGGILQGEHDFEFYEMLKPKNVETLPVGKKFDQFGPVQFTQVGKVREINIRLLPTGNKFDFIIYSSDNLWQRGSVSTIPNQERTYTLSMPKGINPNIFRMEISANEVFHRFDARLRVNIDGAQTANKWVQIK